jgi:response regulator RpfG family c-di-GMP phosphodiesterase
MTFEPAWLWPGPITDPESDPGSEFQQQLRDLNERLAERNQGLERAQEETVRRLAIAAEYRDDHTGGHTARVANTAALLAERTGQPKRFVSLMASAAPLHDVGKVAIPDHILLKPGPLNSTERDEMRSHVGVGARMLAGSSSQVIQLAEEIARTHHEHWDGSGYPEGLAAKEIPLSGRLVAVADVFDALTQPRPYKRAWPVPEAVAEIAAGRGTHFDPQAVDAFMSLDHECLTSPNAPIPEAAGHGRWPGTPPPAVAAARSARRS